MPGEIYASAAQSMLAKVKTSDPVTAAGRDLALEHLDDLRRLDQQIKDSKKRIATAVAASGTTLLELFGVGPVVACMLIGYTGDVRRFPTRHAYAMYNGTAPIDVSSGGRITRRLNRRGNRQLNHAIHIAAVTQLRHHHSEGRGHCCVGGARGARQSRCVPARVQMAAASSSKAAATTR
jgi:transposase